MNTTGTVLSSAESAAIEAVREYALQSKGRTLPAIRALLKRYRLEHIDIDNAIRIILYGKRITVNFHPDSVVKGGKTVIESLLCEGEYHNQFVTGISNGHLSCRKDDLRDVWETKIFGAQMALKPQERPKYGCVNIFGCPDGALLKYGSCFLNIKPDVVERCTFLVADKREKMLWKGTADSFYVPMLAMMLETVKTGQLFGKPLAGLHGFFDELFKESGGGVSETTGGNIFGYGLEAHVFGRLSMAEDVESICIDRSYKGSGIHLLAEELASRYRLEVRWIAEKRCPAAKLEEMCAETAFAEFVCAFRDRMSFDYLNARVLGKMREFYFINQRKFGCAADDADWNRFFKNVWNTVLLNASPDNG